jgi:hypothetical protein
MAWIPFWAAGVINGVGHCIGYRNWKTKDQSKNIFPFGIIVGGEELHNNHHNSPGNPKLSDKEIERRRKKLIEMRNDPEFIKKQEEGFRNCKNMNYSQKFLDNQKSENKRGEKSPNWKKKASKETREKLSKSYKRSPERTKKFLEDINSPEAKEKRRQKILGQKRSQEVREKISGENNPFYGQTHTIEAREKMSQSKINKTPEQKLETYIKFYISRMGYEPSEEQKQNKLQEYIKKKEK